MDRRRAASGDGCSHRRYIGGMLHVKSRYYLHPRNTSFHLRTKASGVGEHEADLEERNCFKRYHAMDKETFHKLVELRRPQLEVNAHFACEF